MASVLGQDGIGRSTLRDCYRLLTSQSLTDPAANLDVISRMLYVDGTSIPSAKHQEYRLQLVAHLPHGTDLVGNTNDLCLICSEEIPFDVRAEQVLPAQCRRKHVWGKQYYSEDGDGKMLTMRDRAMFNHISPHHYSVCPHMFDLSCESATTEPANARKSKVHRAGHVECGYFVSKMWRTLAKCSVGCYFLHGCIAGQGFAHVFSL
jgi:hypothetical protein